MKVDTGLNEQYIVIAGGFRGMGFELTKLLFGEGANVFLIGRTPEKGEAAKVALSRFGNRIKYFTGDLSDSEVLKSARNEVNMWCGGNLHHLVVFLGSGKTPFGYDFDINHWKNIFDINFYVPVAVVQAFYPMMLHRKGNPSITLTGAIAGVERVRAPMTYSIAKTALIAYANHLAESLVGKGIRVNTISPGNVFYKGGRWEEILAEKGSEIKKFIKQSVGMQRLGNAEELAWVYFNVMSPKNSFMTGQNIVSDGLQTKRFL